MEPLTIIIRPRDHITDAARPKRLLAAKRIDLPVPYVACGSQACCLADLSPGDGLRYEGHSRAVAQIGPKHEQDSRERTMP